VQREGWGSQRESYREKEWGAMVRQRERARENERGREGRGEREGETGREGRGRERERESGGRGAALECLLRRLP
jgi:hypothetical protein